MEIDTKLKQSHIFCDHFYYKTLNCKIEELNNYKKGLHFQCQASFTISNCYIIKTAFMNFPLNRIYIKRSHSSYIILSLKNIFVPASFPLDNTYNIRKLLLFQLKKNWVLRTRNGWGYNKRLKIRINFSITL